MLCGAHFSLMSSRRVRSGADVTGPPRTGHEQPAQGWSCEGATSAPVAATHSAVAAGCRRDSGKPADGTSAHVASFTNIGA